MVAQVTSRPAAAQDLRDLVRLRRARDQMDRDYAKPLHVPALARVALMSPGHFSQLSRRLRGDAAQLPDDAPDRAGQGAAAAG
jgi:AraC-like DNA-binding protein